MHRSMLTALAALMLLAPSPEVRAGATPSLSSPWQSEPHARVRLIAGGPVEGVPGAIAAGIEIQLAEGWKTYWRNPGSSGVPPLFEFAASSNLAAAEVRYPAPRRYVEREGATIGYKEHVILPVVLRAGDNGRPISLDLAMEYGVCKDICVPVQARMTLELPPDAQRRPQPPGLAAALERVPRPQAARRPMDPTLAKAEIDLTSPKPAIHLDVSVPGGTKDADVFVEAPDGAWIPMAELQSTPGPERARFVIDLTDGADVPALKGKTLRLTLVSPHGQSESTLRLE